MKKNLAKRIVLGLLTGAVLMSSSVAWAEAEYGYKIDLGMVDDNGYVYHNETIPKDSLSIGGYIAERQTNGNGVLTSPGSRKSVAIGVKSVVGTEGYELYDNVAVGYFAEVGNCSGGTAIGSMTKANAANSTALGFSAVADGSGSVALGSGSKVEFAEQYVVSVGHGGSSGGVYDISTDPNIKVYVPNTRHIINITDVAVDDLDDSDYGSYAVNVNTLNIALENIETVTDIDNDQYDNYAVNVKTLRAALANISGAGENSGNFVETETDNDGGTKTDIGNNFVITDTAVDNSTTTTTVTINENDANNPIVMNNEGITVGTNSTRMDGTGFYVWADGQNNNTTSDHDPDKAIASINDKGEIKGVNGTFSGNVTATKLYIDKGNGSTIDVENELGKKANSADVYKKTETYSQTEVDSKVDALKQVDLDLQTQINNIGGDNTAAIAGINQRLEKTNAKINKVGAGAAALAALHPLDYDPDDKLTFSAGMGNYAGENAAALGAFYRPNEKFMVSLGGTMGNGENMVNLGLSIGLDKASGFAKMSKRELIQEVNAVKAENEAMKDQLANADERIAKLEALVAQLVAK